MMFLLTEDREHNWTYPRRACVCAVLCSLFFCQQILLLVRMSPLDFSITFCLRLWRVNCLESEISKASSLSLHDNLQVDQASLSSLSTSLTPLPCSHFVSPSLCSHSFAVTTSTRSVLSHPPTSCPLPPPLSSLTLSASHPRRPPLSLSDTFGLSLQSSGS